MTSFFTTNPPVDNNPTMSNLKEAITNLQNTVGSLAVKVDKLEKEVYHLEEANFKLSKKVKSMKDSSSHKLTTKESTAKLEELRKKEELLKKKKEEEEAKKKKAAAEKQESFGGGGMFFDYDDESSDDDDNPLTHGLGHDTFSLLKVKRVMSFSWLFTMLVYSLQVALLFMILAEQFSAGEDSTPFGMPFRVDTSVRIGQIIGVLVTISLGRDIFLPIKEMQTLWFTHKDAWLGVTGPLKQNNAFGTWFIRIFIPNILQLFVGILSTFISFIIIIQSDNVIDLFANFAAMSVIGELDNIAFWFAENGYVGDIIMNDAQIVQAVEITEEITEINLFLFKISFRSLLYILLTACVMTAYTPFAYRQHIGVYFTQKYPKCFLTREQINAMGNEVCDGGIQNSIECGFDDGDCIEFNIGYPGCFVSKPSEVGDTVCHPENDLPECKYDGGDCCEISVNHKELVSYLGDESKTCHAGHFFTARCLYDNGDCDAIREDYPNCPDVEKLLLDDSGLPIALGTGVCDQGKEDLKDYMNDECGWVFGDCEELKAKADKRLQQYPTCSFPDMWRIGDGYCDRGEFNYLNEQCGWDKFDCCPYDTSKIGDGVCDSLNGGDDYLTAECGYELYDCCETRKFDLYVNNGNCGDTGFDMNTFLPIPREQMAYNKECAFEGTDCFIPDYPACQVPFASYIGDGKCNGGVYNTEDCGWDGGDCVEHNANYPFCNFTTVANIGNGLCDKENLNVQECGFDGGDCNEFNSKYGASGCDVGDQMYKVGNGYCDYSPFQNFNDPECNFDGGDCDEDGNPIFNPLSPFNVAYPNCHAEEPNRVGDGSCRGDYNTKECGWDGGDCLELNLRLLRLGIGPNCNPGYPQFLGDGICNGGQYNSEDCDYDGGDCTEFNLLYPNCNTNFPRQVGNGLCESEENNEDCGWDGGDCAVEGFPDCHPPQPRYIGDGECDIAFNTTECGFDNGDCLD